MVAARIPEVPENFTDACVPYEEKFPILYDLIITSNDLIMPVDAAVVHPTGVYLYCPNKNVDRRKAEKFLNEMRGGLEAGRKREGHERGEKVPTEAF